MGREQTQLPNLGPTVLPIHGKAGIPIRMPSPEHSARKKSVDPNHFRANQYKETMTTNFRDIPTVKPKLKTRPSPLDPQLAFKATSKKFCNSYLDVPIV